LQTKANALQPSDYPTASKTAISELKAGIKDVSVQLSTLRKGLGWKAQKAQKMQKQDVQK
jgi:hypothetical protein